MSRYFLSHGFQIIIFPKLGIQRQNNSVGVGIIGVVELDGDILQVTHNKQDFETSSINYRKVIKFIEQKLRLYWEAHRPDRKPHKKNKKRLAKRKLEETPEPVETITIESNTEEGTHDI